MPALQSRLLRGGPDGYSLYTVDHEDGTLRLDMSARWEERGAPVPSIPEDELICDPSAGWLCSQLDCKVGGLGRAGRVVVRGAAALCAVLGQVGMVQQHLPAACAGPGHGQSLYIRLHL